MTHRGLYRPQRSARGSNLPRGSLSCCQLQGLPIRLFCSQDAVELSANCKLLGFGPLFVANSSVSLLRLRPGRSLCPGSPSPAQSPVGKDAGAAQSKHPPSDCLPLLYCPIPFPPNVPSLEFSRSLIRLFPYWLEPQPCQHAARSRCPGDNRWRAEETGQLSLIHSGHRCLQGPHSALRAHP